MNPSLILFVKRLDLMLSLSSLFTWHEQLYFIVSKPLKPTAGVIGFETHFPKHIGLPGICKKTCPTINVILAYEKPFFFVIVLWESYITRSSITISGIITTILPPNSFKFNVKCV